MIKQITKIIVKKGIVLVSALTLAACDVSDHAAEQSPDPHLDADQTSINAHTNQSKVLATINQQEILESDIEASIALKLFDLDWAKYELKRAALSEYVADMLKQDGHVKTNVDQGSSTKKTVAVMLEPPMPPRIEQFDPYNVQYVKRIQPYVGSKEANIEISIFCNYQSIHCARMAKTYEQLNNLYDGQLKFVYYDFPQKFHRYSAVAAQAARCAYQHKQLVNYQSALWASQNDLKPARLTQLGKQLGINEQKFASCMAQENVRSEIKQNMQLASELGLTSVPVTLVNGLYLNGPKSIDDLRFYIDKEIARTGNKARLDGYAGKSLTVKAAEKQIDMPKTELALRLEAVSLAPTNFAPSDHSSSTNAAANIRLLDDDVLMSYAQDEQIMEGVYLVLIEMDRVIIENDGRLEYLPLESTSKTQTELIVDATDSQVEHAYESIEGNVSRDSESSDYRSDQLSSKYQAIPEDVLAEDLEYTARPIVASTGTLPLSKEWVDEQLQQQAELASGFKAAAHEVEGKHLLKLRGVGDSEFYQMLGLEEGDAVMRVNGEWVHEQHNNLFDVLENEDHVSIVLMRKGLPVHLEYAIR